MASLRSEASSNRPGSSVPEEVGVPECQDSSPGLGETEQGTDAACPGLWANSPPLWLPWLTHHTCQQVLDKVPTQGSCTPGSHCAITSPHPPLHWLLRPRGSRAPGAAAATGPIPQPVASVLHAGRTSCNNLYPDPDPRSKTRSGKSREGGWRGRAEQNSY